MILPKFLFTENLYNECIKQNLIVKEYSDIFNNQVITCYSINDLNRTQLEKLFDTEFLSESKNDNKTNKSFCIKIFAHIFNLMKICNTPSDYLALINCAISLYQLDPSYGNKILPLIKLNPIPNVKIQDKNT